MFQRKCFRNQTVWPVIFDFTGPICARAPNPQPRNELSLRGHHDWPVKSDNRKLTITKIADQLTSAASGRGSSLLLAGPRARLAAWMLRARAFPARSPTERCLER